MPVWNFNGRWNKVPWARQRLGLDVYLCCPGPSLATVDPEAFRAPGVFTVAMNTAYPKIRPDLWIGMDRPPCYASSLMMEAFPKLMRGGLQDVMWGGRKACEYPQTYFIDVEDSKKLDILDRLLPESKMVWRKNTFFVALNALVWMGARRIHLVGCDFGGAADYYDDRVLSKEHRTRNQKLYGNILRELRPLAADFGRAGIKLISCTKDSPLNSFLEYVPLAEALASSRACVDADAPILPSPNAELCTWNHKISHDEGVVVLADANVEWMLPWWFARYRRFNAKPVQFVDNGMSRAGVAFCKAHGLHLSLRQRSPDMEPLPGWSAKPAAILSSPFRRTLYMDLDCEVLSNLDHVFALAHDGLHVHRDIPWEKTEAFKSRFGADEIAYNSGVVAVSHGHSLVEKWAAAIALDPRKYFGDQDYLTELSRANPIQFLPSEDNNLRLDPYCSAASIRHHTGPAGKAKVRAESRPPDRALDFTEHAREVFNHLVGRGPMIGAEVGTFYGRTAIYLLNMLPDLELTMVDPWISVPPTHRYALSGDETAKYTQVQMDAAANYVAASTAFAKERKRIMRMTSLEAVKKVPDKSLDFAFLDADHTYEGCREDILAWWPKVKPGGFLCGHDLDNQPPAGALWGVRQAVEEFVKNNGLSMTKGRGYTWFVDKS